MINFLNLEYFLVAAEELNFTKAAKKLFISQQSLSNHISNMEKEFDVILFNRTTPLTLTYAGQALKAKARQMLELRDETYRELYYTGYPTNYHHLADSYVDEMTDKILVEKDADVRMQESQELQQYMAEIVPQVPLYVPDLVIAYNKNLQGTYLFGGGNHVWSHAYVALESAE